MAKPKRLSRTGRKPTSRRRRRDAQKRLPWAIGGAVLLVVGLVVAQRALEPKSPEDGPTEYEWLAGITGASYDAGETRYSYPNPGGLASGRKWLPSLGDEGAPVLMVEFTDLHCGHCRDFNLNTLPGILESYVATGQVRYVDHFYGFNRSLQEGTVQSLLCAAEQGRYFEYKHALFQTLEIGSFDPGRAARVAGLEADQHEACLTDDRYLPAIQEMLFDDNSGVTATPTFFINGQIVSGNAPQAIRQAIEDALAAR